MNFGDFCSSGQKSFDDPGESCLHSDSDALLTEIVESDKPLFLLIREANNEHLVEEILRCATAVKMVDIHSEAIQDAFAVIVKRVHEKSLATKIVVSHSNQGSKRAFVL